MKSLIFIKNKEKLENQCSEKKSINKNISKNITKSYFEPLID